MDELRYNLSVRKGLLTMAYNIDTIKEKID